MLKPTYILPRLPPPVELETVQVLKSLNRASRALANLKGQARTIPNQGILIDTVALQEAKASSVSAPLRQAPPDVPPCRGHLPFMS